MNLRERRWHLLVFTAVGSFMAPFDGSVVAVALPKMSAALQLGFIGAVWVQAAYLLAMTVVLIPLGRLADSHGRLRFYRAGLVGFAVTSLFAALSRDVTWLLAARVAQGLSSALLAANGAALIAEAFPPHERGRALGLNSTAVYLGLALGPVLGGVLTQQLGWRSIFLVNVPIALLTLWWGRALAEEKPRGVRAVPDLLGTALWAVALCAGLIAVTAAPVWGWSAPFSLGLFAIAVLALAGFVWAEVRQGTPMLDLGRLVHNRLFAAGSAAALLNYTAFFGITTLTAIFLEVGSGRSAQAAGLLLLVQPLLMVSFSALAGRLSDRHGSRWLATGGMLLIVVGLVLLSALPAPASVPRLEAALGLVGIGMAAFSAPNTAAVMGAVDRAQFGIASGTLSTMRFLGQSLSVALLGTVATSRLGPVGEQLLFSAAGRAHVGQFVAGYHAAMGLAAVIALAGAVASLVRSAGASPAPPRGFGAA